MFTIRLLIFSVLALLLSAVLSAQDTQYPPQGEQIPGPPIVVFQDLDDPPVAATFGEIMCSTYQAFGAAGLITSGAARDLDQVRRIGFPAFSSRTILCRVFSTP